MGGDSIRLGRMGQGGGKGKLDTYSRASLLCFASCMCGIGFSLLLSLGTYIDPGGLPFFDSPPSPRVIPRALSLDRLSLHHVTAYGSDKTAMMAVLERDA